VTPTEKTVLVVIVVLVCRIDLFEVGGDAVCITTNGVLRRSGDGICGAGVARQARDRFPGLERALGSHLRSHGNHVGVLIEGPTAVVSFPTKEDWRDRSDLDLVLRSCRELVALADERGWGTVALPAPGCGLGGLSWDRVRDAIAPILDDRFIVCVR